MWFTLWLSARLVLARDVREVGSDTKKRRPQSAKENPRRILDRCGQSITITSQRSALCHRGSPAAIWETQTEIKTAYQENGLVGQQQGSQDRIRELEDQNQLLQTQLEARKNFDSLGAGPLCRIALASQGKPARW